MTALYIASSIIAALLLGYLVLAMLKPELFQ